MTTGIAHPVECEKLISHHARQKNFMIVKMLCIETGVKFLSLKWWEGASHTIEGV